MNTNQSAIAQLKRKECDNKSNSAGFNLKPYKFRLTNLLDEPLFWQWNCIVNKAIISCPPFYVLLDHLVAVLWIVYSSTDNPNLNKLTPSDIEWSMHFLRALNDYGCHDDMRLILSHLQETLVQIYARKEVYEITSVRSDVELGNKSSERLYSNLQSFVLCDMIGQNKELVESVMQLKGEQNRRSEQQPTRSSLLSQKSENPEENPNENEDENPK